MIVIRLQRRVERCPYNHRTSWFPRLILDWEVFVFSQRKIIHACLRHTRQAHRDLDVWALDRYRHSC